MEEGARLILYLIKHRFEKVQSLVSSFLSNLCSFKMCWYCMSDNVGAASLFLSLFISSRLLWNCVLFHITPAVHPGLHNINAEPKTRKGHNFVWLSPMIRVAWSSSVVSFPAGDKYCEFLCYNFQYFDRPKCVTKFTSVIFYIVSDPQCVNTTCHLLSQIQVVVPVVTVATFAK
jgi:hypothetical protein